MTNSTGYIEMRTHVQFWICVYILVCPVELATGHKSNPKNKKGKSNIITKKEKKKKKTKEIEKELNLNMAICNMFIFGESRERRRVFSTTFLFLGSRVRG